MVGFFGPGFGLDKEFHLATFSYAGKVSAQRMWIHRRIFGRGKQSNQGDRVGFFGQPQFDPGFDFSRQLVSVAGNDDDISGDRIFGGDLAKVGDA